MRALVAREGGDATAPNTAWPAPRDPFPWSHVARTLALLAATGASLGLFVALLATSWPLASFLTKNTIATPERHRLLLGIAIGGALMTAPGLVALLLRTKRAVAPLRRAAALTSPLCTLFLLPILFAHRAWHEEPLPYLVLLATFALVLERSVAFALENVPEPLLAYLGRHFALPTRLSHRLAFGVVVAGAAAYAAYMGHYTLLNHRRFGTSAFDLGIYDNLMFNALHGAPFRSPVLFGPSGGNYIAGHAEFVMLLFAPIYALHPGSSTLLVLQAVFFGFAAVPLFAFARTQTTPWSAAILALLYLFYAPLHGPQFYDFHWLPFAIFFHFALYYAIAKRRYVLAWACVFVLFSVREDVAVGLCVLGAFLLLTGARARFGAALAVVSAAWFVVDKFVIMPWAGRWWFANLYKELIAEGEEGYGSVVRTVLVNPAYFTSTLLREAKVEYLLHLLAPLAFLPWRTLQLAALATLPGFFFTLMTTGYGPTLSIAFQYTTHWVPYLFLAAALGLRLLPTMRRRAALFAATAAMASHSYVFGAILQHDTFIGGFSPIHFSMTAEEEARYVAFRELVKLLPNDAVVAASDNVLPHVSARATSYNLRDNHGDAEYLLVDKHMMGLGNSKKNITEATKRNTYGLVGRRGDFLLFRKGPSSPEADAALTELGITTQVPR